MFGFLEEEVCKLSKMCFYLIREGLILVIYFIKFIYFIFFINGEFFCLGEYFILKVRYLIF